MYVCPCMVKPKNRAKFFTSPDESMKPNLSQKPIKFTEELVGISWYWIQVVYFKLKEIWPAIFHCWSKKKRARFFFFFFFEWKLLNANLSQKALKLASNDNLLHWGTGRYLMNWIQVVYFKLKEIWPLFSNAKAQKTSSFFTSLDESFWNEISVKRPWS